MAGWNAGPGGANEVEWLAFDFKQPVRTPDFRAVGLSWLTLIIVRFPRDYRELRFKHTIIPLP